MRANDSPKLIVVGALEVLKRPTRQRAETIGEKLNDLGDPTVVFTTALADLNTAALGDLNTAALADLDALLNELLGVTHEDLLVWWR